MVLNKLITFHDPWGHQIQSKLSVLLFTGQAILRRNRTGPKVTITPCCHSLLLYVLQPPLDQLPGAVLPQLKCAPTTHSYQKKRRGSGTGLEGRCRRQWWLWAMQPVLAWALKNPMWQLAEPQTDVVMLCCQYSNTGRLYNEYEPPQCVFRLQWWKSFYYYAFQKKK